jgi:RNA polymerase sigma factor (sigma-70 family)
MEIDLRRDKQFEKYQSFLFPFAYNITGDFLASEDIVIEVLNHHILTENQDIRNPKHYLIKSVVNKAINQKQLLRTRREQYPGFWLPSPVVTADTIYQAADKEKIIEYSLMVLMEQLTPKERAVFILKETFDLSHEEIGELLGIKTDSSRQLLKRSKEKLQSHDSKSATLDTASKDLMSSLAEAILSADIDRAKSLLASDVQFISDGGPTIRSSRKVLVGPDPVFKMLQAIYGKYAPEDQTTAFAELNHSPAILFLTGGKVFRAVVFNIQNGRIANVFTVINPDKVQKVG